MGDSRRFHLVANTVNNPDTLLNILAYNLYTLEYEGLSKDSFIKEVDLHIVIKDKPCET